VDGEEVVVEVGMIGILHLRIQGRGLRMEHSSKRDGDPDFGLERWVERLLGMLLGIEVNDSKNLWYHKGVADGLAGEVVVAATTMLPRVEVVQAQVLRQGMRAQVSDPQVEDSHRKEH